MPMAVTIRYKGTYQIFEMKYIILLFWPIKQSIDSIFNRTLGVLGIDVHVLFHRGNRAITIVFDFNLNFN